jgi:hypothetical protein
MKTVYTLLLCFVTFVAEAQDNKVIKTGMNRVRLEFMLDANGQPSYAVYYGDKTVVKPSAMGFTLANDAPFDKGFIVTGSEQSSFDEAWKPVWGEVSSIRNHYQQVTIHLKQ